MGSGDLELLLLAVQHGALNDNQLEECLREWEARGGEAIGTPDPIKTVVLDKGFLTEASIRELVAARKKSSGSSSVRVDVLMGCRVCGAEQVLGLDSALRKPVCPSCSKPLGFKKQVGGTSSVKAHILPLPEAVQKASEDPKNRFGRYIILQKLGVGGMGEVFKAWDSVLARPVALKFPRTVGEEEVRRLYIEAQGAGGLSHPNIASVYEIAEAEGRHYIAMQFIEGVTAEDKVAERPGVREIARWIRDAALGVHYAHERGVIHRDLKPPNMMIDTEGRVFVMDFGLAKMQASGSSGTVSGMILGTPAFMPPEQAAGNIEQIDRRSDVYSLGSTLFLLLTGRRPFNGETATDILVQILTADPLPLRKVDPSLPWELEAIVSRAMQRPRDLRYQTAHAMADDLDRYLKGEAIQARRATFRHAVARKIHRNRWPIIAGAAFLLLGVALWLNRKPEAPAPGPDRFKEWSAVLDGLRSSLSPDAFRAETAFPLLKRVEMEFPEQQKTVDSLIDDDHREVSRALEGLPKSRWLEERARVERYRDWLRFVRKPTQAADLILAYRGTFSLTIHVRPYAEVSGPFAEGLAAPERTTPLALRNLDIRDGTVELTHPAFGSRSVTLPPLKNGGEYVIEGEWKEKDSIRVREGR